jgi:hypothetical protein
MIHSKVMQPGTGRHQEERKELQEMKNERLWEERKYWTLFVHQPI